MILDCFPFWKEWDCLEIRLHELVDVVDVFIAVEATTTHSGRPKPPFLQMMGRRQRWPDKARIGTMAVLDMPVGPDDWAREHHQRNAISSLLALYAKPGDLVMISDCDEIPSAQAVEKAIPIAQQGEIVRFDQPLCYYYLNACLPPEGHARLCTRMALAETVERLTPQGIRIVQEGPVVSPGGWHFGWLGDANFAREKIQSFAHQELNHKAINDPDYLAWCIAKGRHPKDLRQIYRFDPSLLPSRVRDQHSHDRSLAPEEFPKLPTSPYAGGSGAALRG